MASRTFAMLTRGPLRPVLSGPVAAAAMPDGTLPRPGGWNRFAIEADDIDAAAGQLRGADVPFRSAIIDGGGGRQVIVDDPSGNPVELFEPSRDEARLR